MSAALIDIADICRYLTSQVIDIADISGDRYSWCAPTVLSELTELISESIASASVLFIRVAEHVCITISSSLVSQTPPLLRFTIGLELMLRYSSGNRQKRALQSHTVTMWTYSDAIK